MRDLKKNQREVWHSRYEGKQPILKNGFETGQYKETYAQPVPVRVSISPATGASETEFFGASVQYDRVLSTVNDLPIDEYSRLWVDAIPNEKADNYDYIVKRVAKGLNQNLWAIARVVR